MDILAVLIVCSIICAFFSCSIYQTPAGFFLGLFFNVFGIIISAILSLDVEYQKEKKKREETLQETIEKQRQEWIANEAKKILPQEEIDRRKYALEIAREEAWIRFNDKLNSIISNSTVQVTVICLIGISFMISMVLFVVL